MSIVLVILGAVLIANGLILSIFSNFDLGILFTTLLGALLIGWGVFYPKVRQLTQKGFFKVVKIIAVAMIVAEILIVSFVAVYGQMDNADYTEDAVVVLGAGVMGDQVTLPLKLRLNKAIEYHSQNPDAFIVVTGGKGYQETVTEAHAMEKYLTENGMPKDKIIKEEKATSTNENMRFSKKILDKRFRSKYKIAVITNSFHIYRGTSIAKSEGFDNVSHLHAGLRWYTAIPCYVRESLAVLKMWVLG